MSDDPVPEPQEPGNLRFLRVLVTVLTATMIGGLIAIFAVIVIRFPGGEAPLPLPDRISLPEGVQAEAVTVLRDRVLVVSGTRLLVFDADGALVQEVTLAP